MNRYSLFPVLLSFIISANILSAQNSYNLKQALNESGDFIERPLNWKAEDWGKAGFVGLAAYLLMNLDEPVRNEIMKDRSFEKSIPIEAGRIWGEWYTSPIIAGLFALHGISNNNSQSKKIGFEIFESAVLTSGSIGIIKLGFGRSRPYMNKGAFDFNPISFADYDHRSFPSGHTGIAFSLSTVLSQNSKSDLVKVLVYIPAFATALSRIYDDEHWLSDTFLGAAIGYFVGKWVCDIHKSNESNDFRNSVQNNQLIVFSIPL